MIVIIVIVTLCVLGHPPPLSPAQDWVEQRGGDGSESGWLCVLVKRGRCVLRTLQYHGCVSVPNQAGASLTQMSQV